MNTTVAAKTLTARYIEASGNHDYAAVENCLTPDVSFKGPNMQSNTLGEYMAALKRMAPIWTRSDIRKIFVDGDDVCVIYDFVTNTEAGAIPTIELLRLRGDRIAGIELFFDRLQFAPAMQALQKLAQQQ